MGHHVDFGGQQATGVVEFGFATITVDKNEVVVLKVLNRRGLTKHDVLGEDRTLVTITANAQPHRLSGEPVAVVVETGLDVRIAALSAEDRLAVYGRVDDGLDMEALRCLFIWADAPA